MLFTRPAIRQKLEQVFEKRQAAVLAEVVEAAYTDLVKTSDFNELKGYRGGAGCGPGAHRGPAGGAAGGRGRIAAGRPAGPDRPVPARRLVSLLPDAVLRGV